MKWSFVFNCIIGNSISKIVKIVVKTIDNSKAIVKPFGSEKKTNIYVKCDHCEFICKNNNLMDANISEKHNSNPDKDLVVEEVEEVLYRRNVEDFVNLKSSKEFKWDQCESKFKKKKKLQKHINGKQLKSEKCEPCKSCFVNNKKELTNHIKKKHIE